MSFAKPQAMLYHACGWYGTKNMSQHYWTTKKCCLPMACFATPVATATPTLAMASQGKERQTFEGEASF